MNALAGPCENELRSFLPSRTFLHWCRYRLVRQNRMVTAGMRELS